MTRSKNKDDVEEFSTALGVDGGCCRGDAGSENRLDNLLLIDPVVDNGFGGALPDYTASDTTTNLQDPALATIHDFSTNFDFDLDFDLDFDFGSSFEDADISQETTDQLLQQFENENPTCTPSLTFEAQMWNASSAEDTIVQSLNTKTASVQGFEGFDFNTNANNIFATIAESTLPVATQLNKLENTAALSVFSTLETHSSSFQDKR
jgi:hypothetical protein